MIKDKISKIDSLTVGLINFIITPVLYLSIISPLVQSGKVSPAIYPIMLLTYNPLFFCLFLYIGRRDK